MAREKSSKHRDPSKHREKSKNRDKEGMLVIIALSVFLVLILFAAFLFVRMMDQRNEMLMQYTAEQNFATYFFRANWDAESDEEMFSDSNVRGLAAYDREGKLLLGLGMVPETYLPPPNPEERNSRSGRAVYNSDTGMIEYSRRMMLSLSISSGAPLPTPDILYIAIDGRLYRLARTRLFSFYGFFSLLIILFMFYTWRMYARNKAYRDTIARQKSLVSLGEAARTLAHEIKNPLSAITLQTAVLKKTLPPEAHGGQIHNGLVTIEDQVRRLSSLADRVKEYIRNARGTPEQIDLPQFIEETAASFGRQLTVDYGRLQARFVDIDRERARSAFENLISNALESRSDGEEPEVTIRICSTASKITVSVADNGDGLPPGQEHDIFDPFFTTKTRGSGIGLAIARRFIEAAGGTLQLSARKTAEEPLRAERGTIAQAVLPGKAGNIEGLGKAGNVGKAGGLGDV